MVGHCGTFYTTSERQVAVKALLGYLETKKNNKIVGHGSQIAQTSQSLRKIYSNLHV